MKLPAMTIVLAILLHSSAFGQTNYQLVGQAKLSVLFWDVYDAELYTDTGHYQGIQPPLLLKLNYLRDISSEDLVEATEDEIRRVAPQIPEEQLQPHIQRLSEIWPDITKGDTLSFEMTANAGIFYFNEALIGRIEDEQFSRAFLAIWLADNSAYPELSRKLRGLP